MESLENRITILEFEHRHLIELLLWGRQERWLPGLSAQDTHEAHIRRYEWAASFVPGRNVLDIACGSGFGSTHLATKGGASHVLGGDYSQDAILYCRAKHGNIPNLAFEAMDGQNFDLSEKRDVIISFETIEHLNERAKFLQCIQRNLQDDGIFIVSTPISKLQVDLVPGNTHHLIEWSISEFVKVVKPYFHIDQLFVQPYHLRRETAGGFRSKFKKLIKGEEEAVPIFEDYKILEIESHSDKWQELVGRNLVGGYTILVCRKSL